MNINAGSDTGASVLRAIFYHLLKAPSTLSKLRSELSSARSRNEISTPCPTWQQTQTKLPYLCAVIKESLRLNPALALTLERIVPAAGMQLRDPKRTFLPPGTVVGINPYVLHRDPRIFGEDPDGWNPDRWLTEEERETKSMEHALLVFGAGKRGCLGRNIAMLELHKLVPAVLMKFDIRLRHPEAEWDVRNAWILIQTGLEVQLSLRKD